MDYEKKYNEALEQAKKELAACGSMDCDAARLIFRLFPQLRESEDEVIRKSIVATIEQCPDDFLNPKNRDRMLAWLEKQKYDRMKPIYDAQESFESALEKAWKDYDESGARTVDSCEDDYVECAHAKGFREGFLFGLEKQKPIDDNAFEEWLDDWYRGSKEAGGEIMMSEYEFKNWSRGIRNMYQQKPTTVEKLRSISTPAEENWFEIQKKWEKEDEQKPVPEHYSPLCNTIKDKIREYIANHFVADTVVKTDVKSIVKAMEEGVRLGREECRPAEWSEENEKKRQRIICLLEQANRNWRMAQNSVPFGDLIDWLISLRPQPDKCNGCSKHLEGYISGRTDAENKLLEQFGAITTPEGELRIKSRWKPSEEQLNALKEAKTAAIGNDYHNRLVDLYWKLEHLTHGDAEDNTRRD